MKYNKDYYTIINEILKNKEFLKTQDTIHHGLIKLDHSIKVSYYSYKIARFLKMDYISVARGGLLHDFFLSYTNGKSISKKSLISTYTHHNIALNNSVKYFKLNDKEKDIIVKHMFPVVFTIPKYKESLLVSFIDKIIGAAEGLGKFKKVLSYNMLSKAIPTYMLLINIVK